MAFEDFEDFDAGRLPPDGCSLGGEEDGAPSTFLEPPADEADERTIAAPKYETVSERSEFSMSSPSEKVDHDEARDADHPARTARSASIAATSESREPGGASKIFDSTKTR